MPFGTWPGWWAAVIQLVGGSAVLIGLFTRPAAVVGSGSMAYAYFVAHQPKALWPLTNGGEPAALFCWAFLAAAALGAGPWSLDALGAGPWSLDALRGRWRHGRATGPAPEAEIVEAEPTAAST